MQLLEKSPWKLREPSFPALPETELELVIIILLDSVRDGAESEGAKAGGGWDYGNIVLYSAEQGAGHTDTGHADIHYAAVTNRIKEKQVCIFFRYNFMKHQRKGFNFIRFPVSIAYLYWGERQKTSALSYLTQNNFESIYNIISTIFSWRRRRIN